MAVVCADAGRTEGKVSWYALVRRPAWLAVCAGVLAACGGEDDTHAGAAAQLMADTAGTTAQLLAPPDSAALRRVALASSEGTAIPGLATDLFDLGERLYPQFFPGHQTDRSAGVLAYRYYPESGAYLLVDQATLEVYVLGGPFGARWAAVGNVRSFLPPPALTLARSGTGIGTVGSTPAGISCGSLCSSSAFGWDRPVTLTATPTAGSLFAGWAGACSGTAQVCNVTMSQAQRVTATFEVPLLTVSVTGTGTVSGASAGIDCGANCTARLAAGTSVTLTATPAPGWSFAGWSGACRGTSATCLVAMNVVERSVAASFRQP